MISIIVPIYNTESYLDKCISSICAQTYSDLEIILVDDGSMDNSLQICHEWAKKDTRIKVFHKQNGGQGSARNLALDWATGQYIGFVDSDDWIEPNMYELLMNMMGQYTVSIAACTDYSSSSFSCDKIAKVYNGVELMKKHLKNDSGFGQSPCDKLYRSEVWENIRFPLTRAYEDCATIYRVLYQGQSLAYQAVPKYHYETRENSTMTQQFSAVKYQAIEAYKKMYEDYSLWYPQLSGSVKERLLGSAMYCVGETCLRNKKNDLKSEYQSTIEYVRSLSFSGLRFKHQVLLFMLQRTPYLFGHVYVTIKGKRGK